MTTTTTTICCTSTRAIVAQAICCLILLASCQLIVSTQSASSSSRLNVPRYALDRLEEKLVDKRRLSSDLGLNLEVARQLATTAHLWKAGLLMRKDELVVGRAARMLVQMGEARECDQTLLLYVIRVLRWRENVAPTEREQPTGRLDTVLRQILASLVPKCAHYLEARYLERACTTTGPSRKIEPQIRAKLDNLLLADDSGPQHSLLDRRPDNGTVLIELIKRVPSAAHEFQTLVRAANGSSSGVGEARKHHKVELSEFLTSFYEDQIRIPCDHYLRATQSWHVWASWLAFFVPNLEQTRLSAYLKQYQACWDFGGKYDREQAVQAVMVGLGLSQPAKPIRYKL